jgi:hypothetical protein
MQQKLKKVADIVCATHQLPSPVRADVTFLAVIQIVMHLCPLADGRWAMSWYKPFALLCSISRALSRLSPSILTSNLCASNLGVTQKAVSMGLDIPDFLSLPIWLKIYYKNFRRGWTLTGKTKYIKRVLLLMIRQYASTFHLKLFVRRQATHWSSLIQSSVSRNPRISHHCIAVNMHIRISHSI